MKMEHQLKLCTLTVVEESEYDQAVLINQWRYKPFEQFHMLTKRFKRIK